MVSCSGELHRNGKMSENYIVSKGELFLTYEHNGSRFILALKLDPLVTKWEKKIADLTDEPVFRLYGDNIVTNCKDGEICFLSRENGSKNFSFESSVIMKKGYKGLTVLENRAYSLCRKNEICSFNIETKEKLWSHQLEEGTDIVFDFMIEGEKLFFGTENQIHALSIKTGKKIWTSDELPDLKTYYTVGETLLVNYEVIEGLDFNDGKSKWLTPYAGDRIRCVMDGLMIGQSETHFNTLFVENGIETTNYKREGITMLDCQSELSLAAYTVRKNPDAREVAEYFDRIDIFNAGTGERVFDFRAEEGKTVLNIAAMHKDYFYIVVADVETDRNARVDRHSYFEWEHDISYHIPDPQSGKNIYITLTHIDSEYTIFRSAIFDFSENTPTKNHLYSSQSGEFIGELIKHPDIITPNVAYDIVIYDTYFNIIEKKITDFLL